MNLVLLTGYMLFVSGNSSAQDSEGKQLYELKVVSLESIISELMCQSRVLLERMNAEDAKRYRTMFHMRISEIEKTLVGARADLEIGALTDIQLEHAKTKKYDFSRAQEVAQSVIREEGSWPEIVEKVGSAASIVIPKWRVDGTDHKWFVVYRYVVGAAKSLKLSFTQVEQLATTIHSQWSKLANGNEDIISVLGRLSEEDSLAQILTEKQRSSAWLALRMALYPAQRQGGGFHVVPGQTILGPEPTKDGKWRGRRE